jgi:HlyD family secretion protein
MRRVIAIVLILAVVGGGSWLAYRQWGAARAPEAPDYEVLTISRGNITATVSATGNALPEREANLSFQGTGTIVHVNVKPGDAVKAGQVLAELDTRDLDLAVRLAEVSVRTAEAQLSQLQATANSVDVSAAQAQLTSAQASYQQLLNGSDQDEQAAARAQVEQAKVALDQAQQAYDKVKDLPNVGMLPQAAQLQTATINYETAQAQFRVNTKGAKQAQLAAAQAQVAQAQAALDKLQRGPAREQLEIAQAGVDQAKLNLQQAQRRLENARVVAPWDGIVTAVNATEGTSPQPALPAVSLADASQYHINVSVDEADIATIAEGQPVAIELDAFANQTLSGHVAQIAPAAAEGAGGVVAYQVRIDIEPSDLVLRAGMSATATITSSSLTNVVLVPNRAIQLDRQTGRTYVERLANAVPQRIEVRLGLRSDQVSEVQAGLVDGDQVIVRQVSGLERLIQAAQ